MDADGDRVGDQVLVSSRGAGSEGPWLQETWNLLERLQGVPVELVWGMKDMGLGNEETIGRWLTHFPDASVTRLPEASHYLQEDEPKAIADAIMRVVARIKQEG